jgi:hypothetical protein
MKTFISAVLAFIIMLIIMFLPSVFHLLPKDGIIYGILHLAWVASLFPLIGYYYDVIREKLGE